MRPLLQTLLAGVAAITAVYGGLIVWNAWSDGRECPSPYTWNFSGNIHCRVLDRSGPRMLIEHLDAEYSVWQLGIYEGGGTLWVRHPLDSDEGKMLVGPNYSSYTIKFDRYDATVLQVNGSRFTIKAVPEKRIGNYGQPPLFDLGR